MPELTLYTCITSALQKWVGGKSLLTDIPHIPPRSTCLFRPLKNKNSISTYNKYYCLPVSAQASYSEGHGSAAVGHSLYGGLACGQGHGQSVPYTPPPPSHYQGHGLAQPGSESSSGWLPMFNKLVLLE